MCRLLDVSRSGYYVIERSTTEGLQVWCSDPRLILKVVLSPRLVKNPLPAIYRKTPKNCYSPPHVFRGCTF